MRAAPAGVLWFLFGTVVVLQASDLGTTYVILSSGGREGNILMRTIILTPAAPLLKAVALLILAALIISSTELGWPSPRRLIAAAGIICALYLVIVLNNLAVLLSL